ncbi:hypothetical protein KOI35_14185 [Actinoplanes bogorensis]|uniref:Uncharacterized protein n=1 Tax=Paractinoplanes bogorensis TaxID=1610840 RepID=A0ABS5YMG1_9ACTN|nr:hypothetical protein [Actinoplanes bogorensis]MBU2664648.1 hypothetical protein [Actinoplanes bogorensis]
MRALVRVVVVGAVCAAGFVVGGPAQAAVTYDPETKKGYVSRADLLKAFGWNDATLAAKASGLVFNHDFWTNDNYTVSCGKRTFPIVHPLEFGRYELFDVTVTEKGRGAAGYGGKTVLGFWLTGPRFGISGTSVGPMVGQPCPQDAKAKITSVKLVSTTTGWGLDAASGEVSKALATKAETKPAVKTP